MRLVLATAFLLTTLFVQAQGFQPWAVPVTDTTGSQLVNPWVGGFNNPQYSEIDLTGDGSKELFVFDRDGNSIYLFEHVSGTNYKYRPDLIKQFPDLEQWALLSDVNCDGLNDLFTYFPGGMDVYFNSGDSNNRFVKQTQFGLKSSYSGLVARLYNNAQDIPALVDVDADGDLDVLAFGSSTSESVVLFHQNRHVEDNLPCDSLSFKVADYCWGKFQEAASNNDLIFNISCKGGGRPVDGGALRHAGSTMLAIDLSGDGIQELLLGDITYNNLSKLNNTGSLANAQMTSVDSAWPSSSPVNIPFFPAAFQIDANHDGNQDVVVSPNASNIAENVNNSWLYTNSSSGGAPNFTLSQKDFLVDQILDFGSGSFPAVEDVTGDGLADIIVGNYGYFQNPGSSNGHLALLKNTGSATAPSFKIESLDWLNVSTFGLFGVQPTFCDIDADGDRDLFLADYNGRIHFFANVNGAFGLAQANYFNIDQGQFAKSDFFDFDGDGDFDLILGEKDGDLNYYENTGTASVAAFSDTPSATEFGQIDVSAFCCGGYSQPVFAKLDNSGKTLLAVAAEGRGILVYDFTGKGSGGAFPHIGTIETNATRFSLATGDLDGDGLNELLVGQYAGGVSLYKTDGQSVVYSKELITDQRSLFFPNPVKDILTLNVKQGNTQVSIYNLAGKQVYHQLTAQNAIDLSGLAGGIYQVVVINSANTYQSMLVKE